MKTPIFIAHLLFDKGPSGLWNMERLTAKAWLECILRVPNCARLIAYSYTDIAISMPVFKSPLLSMS
jgi:hypothetical protein